MRAQYLLTGDFGLDLVLGEGVATLARMEGLGPSASILIRGGPGAGKTLLGSQLAITLAEQRLGDVAYACVELLPNELHAQLESLWPNTEGSAPRIPAVPNAVHEGFRTPPFAARSSHDPHVYASALPLPAGHELDTFGSFIDKLLSAIERAGGRPSVLVIDSLAVGYNLADAPRDFADSLVKLAVERGLILILLEEAEIGRLSAWTYAVDIAIELDHLDRSATPASQLGRRLWVTKNRFGPSTSAPNRFSILEHQGVRVFPAEVTYATPWAEHLGAHWRAARPALPSWGFAELDAPALGAGISRNEEGVVFVRGAERDIVRSVAALILSDGHGRDVWIDFGHRANPATLPTQQQHDIVLGLGNPLLSSQRLIYTAVDILNHFGPSGIRRVVIGDLAALEMFYEADDLRRAIAILVGLLDKWGICAVLFETTAPTAARAPAPLTNANLGPWPKLMDWADATVEIFPGAGLQAKSVLRMTHRSSARSFELGIDRDTLRRAQSRRWPLR